MSVSLQAGLFQELESRGIVKQVTDPALAQVMAKEPLTLYCGFDPTSDSLHLGSLLPLLTLRRFQQAGHKVIALVGGATGMIGDPSGKSAERQLLTPEILKHNVAGITKVVSKFLDLTGPNAATVVNNADWFGMTYIDFLRDVGKHFTINHMMAKESVRARLEDREHGISYTEFSYMLLQAYDFYVLNEKKGCRLQIGGSDQWGNITAGNELIRRMRAAEGKEGPEVFGLTWPLVTKSDGGKFGKSESGNVWLDPARTSPYQLYQFLIQTPDADVGNYLRIFTFLSLEEIARLEAAVKSAPEKREAQTALARELTRLVHGDEELKKVEQASQALFSKGGSSLKDIQDAATLKAMFSEAPLTKKPKSALGALTLIDAVVEAGLCPSKGQAKKDIAAGGIYLNDERVSDIATTLKPDDLLAGAFIVLRKGKKTYHILQFDV